MLFELVPFGQKYKDGAHRIAGYLCSPNSTSPALPTSLLEIIHAIV